MKWRENALEIAESENNDWNREIISNFETFLWPNKNRYEINDCSYVIFNVHFIDPLKNNMGN